MPPPPCRLRLERRILFRLGKIAVKLHDQRCRPEYALQPLRRPPDFRLPRQEGDDRAGLAAVDVADRRRHGVLDAFAGGPVAVADLDWETAPLAADEIGRAHV